MPAFYLECPLCDKWRSHEFDESYWHLRYRLDCITQYERHVLQYHSQPVQIVEVPT